MTGPSVADVVADELADHGVDRVFGLPGGEVLSLMDALRRRGIDYTLFRHEADAGLAAGVYGKLKGTAGVVLTTLGPGAANLLLPIANSLLDREPLVAISAQIPSTWSPLYTHQRLPLAEVFRPVTKMARAIHPFGCRSVVRQALVSATAEPQGPTFLTLSAEDAIATAREGALGRIDESRSPSWDVDAPARVRTLLEQAERPLLLLGLGTGVANAEAIRRWITEWNLPVAVTPKVKGIIDECSDQFVGVISGMAIDEVMLEALRNADLLVGLGLDPVEIDKRWHVDLPIQWVADAQWATGVHPKEHIAAEIGWLAREIVALGPPRKWNAPFAATIAKRKRFLAETRGEELTPLRMVTLLAEVLPSNTIVTTDVGSHKYVFGQFWPSREPETFFMSNGLSGMGYGLPAAIGAKLARPDRPVLAVLGDGGFAMNGEEIDTARRLGVALIVVVIADRSYSLIRISQEKRKLPRYGVDFDAIDTLLAARSCGVEAVRATTATELRAHVSDALRSASSLVVEIPVSPEQYRDLV
jgi:acetolactate synthase-1/2/3 large subunit